MSVLFSLLWIGTSKQFHDCIIFLMIDLVNQFVYSMVLYLLACSDSFHEISAQLCLINHSELITGTYELSFLATTNTLTSNSFELPLNHLECISVDQKKYSTNNSSASPVFLIHVSVAISYHISHNVILTFLMNITYLLNYI
jgi:hypothetical protein